MLVMTKERTATGVKTTVLTAWFQVRMVSSDGPNLDAWNRSSPAAWVQGRSADAKEDFREHEAAQICIAAVREPVIILGRLQ